MFIWTTLWVLTFGNPSHPQNYEAALALADAQNKPLLVYFHTTWCAGCKRFDRQLAKGDFKDLLEQVVFFTADCTDSEKSTFVSNCEDIKGYPSFQIHQHGKVQEQWLASDGAIFRQQVEHYLAGSSYLKSLEQAYRKSLSVEDGEALAKAYRSLSLNNQAMAMEEALLKIDPSVKRVVQILTYKGWQVHGGTYSFKTMVKELDQFILNQPEEKGYHIWAINRIRFNLPKDLIPKILPKYIPTLENMNLESLPETGYPFEMVHAYTLAHAYGVKGNPEKGYKIMDNFSGKDLFTIHTYQLEFDYRLDTFLDNPDPQKNGDSKSANIGSYFKSMAMLKTDPVKGWENYKKQLGDNWQSNFGTLNALLSATQFNVLIDQILANADTLLDFQPDPDVRRTSYVSLMNAAVLNQRWKPLGSLLERARREGLKHSFFDYWAETYGSKIAASP